MPTDGAYLRCPDTQDRMTSALKLRRVRRVHHVELVRPAHPRTSRSPARYPAKVGILDSLVAMVLPHENVTAAIEQNDPQVTQGLWRM